MGGGDLDLVLDRVLDSEFHPHHTDNSIPPTSKFPYPPAIPNLSCSQVLSKPPPVDPQLVLCQHLEEQEQEEPQTGLPAWTPARCPAAFLVPRPAFPCYRSQTNPRRNLPCPDSPGGRGRFLCPPQLHCACPHFPLLLLAPCYTTMPLLWLIGHAFPTVGTQDLHTRPCPLPVSTQPRHFPICWFLCPDLHSASLPSLYSRGQVPVCVCPTPLGGWRSPCPHACAPDIPDTALVPACVHPCFFPPHLGACHCLFPLVLLPTPLPQLQVLVFLPTPVLWFVGDFPGTFPVTLTPTSYSPHTHCHVLVYPQLVSFYWPYPQPKALDYCPMLLSHTLTAVDLPPLQVDS